VHCKNPDARPTSQMSFLTYTHSQPRSPVEISVQFGRGAGDVTSSVHAEFEHLWQRLGRDAATEAVAATSAAQQ